MQVIKLSQNIHIFKKSQYLIYHVGIYRKYYSKLIFSTLNPISYYNN